MRSGFVFVCRIPAYEFGGLSSVCEVKLETLSVLRPECCPDVIIPAWPRYENPRESRKGPQLDRSRVGHKTGGRWLVRRYCLCYFWMPPPREAASQKSREGRAAVRFPAALRVNVHSSGTGGWLSSDHEDLVTRQPN